LEGDYLFYSCGESLDLSADAEHNAKRGEIVTSLNVAIPEYCEKYKIDESFSRLMVRKFQLKIELKNKNFSNLRYFFTFSRVVE